MDIILNNADRFFFNCNAQYLIAMLEGKQAVSLEESYYIIKVLNEKYNDENIIPNNFDQNGLISHKKQIIAKHLIRLASIYREKTNNQEFTLINRWQEIALQYIN